MLVPWSVYLCDWLDEHKWQHPERCTEAEHVSAQADMKKKVEKWQEPAPAKQHKVLPVPDMEPKKRRGGRRFRKMKERYGLTDMRKAANRYVACAKFQV